MGRPAIAKCFNTVTQNEHARLGLVRRTNCRVPTARGWLVLFLAVAGLAWYAVHAMQPFLAVTHPVRGQILVLDPWLPDYALAVAHTVQCPYCIDAYTQACLDKGSDMSEMTEAVHVAVAIRGGVPLVHGIQMRNIAQRISM
jgi:AhpD family alkylhydroperoxidase